MTRRSPSRRVAREVSTRPGRADPRPVSATRKPTQFDRILRKASGPPSGLVRGVRARLSLEWGPGAGSVAQRDRDRAARRRRARHCPGRRALGLQVNRRVGPSASAGRLARVGRLTSPLTEVVEHLVSDDLAPPIAGQHGIRLAHALEPLRVAALGARHEPGDGSLARTVGSLGRR